MRSFLSVFLIVFLANFISGSMFSAEGAGTLKISVTPAGGEPDGESFEPSVSANGRYITFASSATNLTNDTDTLGFVDVFVYDVQTGLMKRISNNAAGGEADGHSALAQISADGRYVLFQSKAGNLLSITEPDTLGFYDIFRYDLTDGTIDKISVRGSDGREANGNSSDGDISPDGRFVVFSSYATNIIASTEITQESIYLRDTLLGTTGWVSKGPGGILLNSESSRPSVSGQGRYVVFQSRATNLLETPDSESHYDIFLRDMENGTNERISKNAAGGEPNGHSRFAVISADGRYIVYQSSADDIVAGDGNGVVDVFLYDRVLGTTELSSISSSGEQQNNGIVAFVGISADGRYVSFPSQATNLVEDDATVFFDIFRRDRQKMKTEMVNLADGGEQADYLTFTQNLSSSGRYVVFESQATNLVTPHDTLGYSDIFLRDMGSDFPWMMFLPKGR